MDTLAVALTIAQTADGVSIVDVVSQGGALAIAGLIIYGFATNKVITAKQHEDRIAELKADHDETKARAATLEARLETQNIAMRDQVIPALHESAAAVKIARRQPAVPPQDGAT